MSSARSAIFCLVILIPLSIAIAHADETDDARRVAVEILQKVEQKKNAEVWQQDVSNWFKERMTKAAFLANLSVTHSKLGGTGSDRTIVQQNTADGDPQSGYKGAVYTFTFATTFPSMKAYEIIVLIRENGTYRISGMNYLPNPN